MFKARLTGVGVWGPGFTNLDEYQHMLTSGDPVENNRPAPKPELIPSRERRRAPLMVKLAVEVAAQASTRAGIDPALMHSVFSSGIGDADTTDYMCRVLAGPDKLLSPTKFHNSVHNAAAGYWSISTGCERPATFVGGMHNSVAMGLIEAMIQLNTENVPVMLVASDLPVPVPMWDMHQVTEAFAAAFVFEPVDDYRGADVISGKAPTEAPGKAPTESQGEVANSTVDLKLLEVSTVVSDSSDLPTGLPAGNATSLGSWPSLSTGKMNDDDAAALLALYRTNPSAKALAIVAMLLNQSSDFSMPLSDGLDIRVKTRDVAKTESGTESRLARDDRELTSG